MSTAKQNGDSQAGATPTVAYDWCGQTLEHGQTGLTKREAFAMAAMQGILSAPGDSVSQDLGPNARGNQECCAKNAVAQADALLAELAKETPDDRSHR